MTAFDVCGGFCTFLQKKRAKVFTTIVYAILIATLVHSVLATIETTIVYTIIATPMYSISNNRENNSL